jgi:hypothetical protein
MNMLNLLPSALILGLAALAAWFLAWSEIPLSVFLLFNLLWIGVWIASVPGLRSARSGAFFAAWFLAIAGIVNGIAHPLLALASGGYFPGLWTSPIIGGICVLLWLRLHKATRRQVRRLRL